MYEFLQAHAAHLDVQRCINGEVRSKQQDIKPTKVWV